MKRRITTISIDEKLIEKLKNIALKENRTFSNLVEKILKEKLEK